MTVVAMAIDFHGDHLEIEATPGELVELRQVSRRDRRLFRLFLDSNDARELSRLLRLAAAAAESRSSEFAQEPEIATGTWGGGSMKAEWRCAA